METLNRLPFKARNAVFKKLEEIVDIAALSKEERMKYDESIKVYRDQLAVMEFERQKGLAEGLEKGLAEGLEKGLAEGIEKGMEKGKEDVARNLKEMGLDVSSISRATGLSPDVIEGL